ncbi:hypothetical protein ABZ957_30445 [Streptomyces sp. NPDC046316]|uniref:hypothetical protein n=1 Tax=Streptomyces sp. NPDC046316 TaxID=3154494 RepID=UPI00340D0790
MIYISSVVQVDWGMAVPDPVIESPLPGAQAFARDDEIAAWSQAAQVVGLGLQLAGQPDVVKEADGFELDPESA